MNPALMVMKYKDEVKQDIQNAYKIVMDEDAKRKANLDQYKHRRGFDSRTGEFKDIKSAIRALKDIEDYIFNHIPKESEWDAFMIFIRKTDIIWKHNFNDYMKKYKFINGQIERVSDV
jgi:hypothetical protein